MPDTADQPVAPKHARSLIGFYVAIGIVMALALFGAWFWTTWNRWWFDAAEARRRQAEAAVQLGLPVEKVIDLGDGVKIELVLIPAGRFRMGSQTSKHDDRGVGYQWVRITKPFYIGKFEVTQEVWEKVTGTNPSKFKGAKNPVESVSWGDCQEFLKKLNALPHPIPLPAGEGARVRALFRLPTEAEWEWACRAGTRTRFCFGDEERNLAEYGWYDDNAGKTTHPVGTKKPNAWGLYDCHGNVWEWCGDRWGDYSYGWRPKADPTGSGTDVDHVTRSGSWLTRARLCRSACRVNDNPDDCFSDGGLRLVASPSRTP